MQGGCLACWRLQGCRIESLLWLSCTDLHFARGAQGVLPMRVGSATSQFDLPSLTPLSVAGCGRLQLGVPHWATSVHYCKLLIIDPTFCGSRFSTGRLMAIEDFLETVVQIDLQSPPIIYMQYPPCMVCTSHIFCREPNSIPATHEASALPMSPVMLYKFTSKIKHKETKI